MPFPVDERFIAAEEERLKVRLPSSFRAHLLKVNGGEVKVAGDTWEVAPVFDASDRKRMARTASHLARETASARDWSGFPAPGVAFASNGAGDRLVFLPDAAEPGRLGEAVYHWNHENGDLERVAASFADTRAGAVFYKEPPVK